jgi:DNA-binding transcriptional LysR family regulator
VASRLAHHAVALFTQRHPDVDLAVVDDHQQGLIPRLARWELDLALIYDKGTANAFVAERRPDT